MILSIWLVLFIMKLKVYKLSTARLIKKNKRTKRRVDSKETSIFYKILVKKISYIEDKTKEAYKVKNLINTTP